MKFFKKFAAVLIAIAMFTVGNISILPRDAVEDFMLSIKAAENVINDININSIEYVTNENREMLLGIDNPDDYFLGAASQFSVFLNGDFTANDYNCEGRLAAAGNANMGEETPYYFVGAKLENADDVAHVVIGGDTLVNFSAYGKNFVMGDNLAVGGEISEYMANGNCKVYVGELFDFEEEFKRLNECVQFLTEQEANAELIVDEYYALGWTIKGEDDNLNVITLTEEQVNAFNGGYIELTLDIPDSSYLVINVPGSHVDMPRTLVYTVDENGLKTPTYENTPLLYNLYEATSFHYTGSIQGSTLAPNADATGNQGGHVAGATIAKSFTGGMEFGYSTFELKMSKTQHNEIIDSGSCGADGDNLTWTLDSDGTLTISGEGEMKNWLLNSSPWYSNKRIGNVIIEDDVTSIGSYAFESCDSLTSITIPDSVTSIGDRAFGSCDSLTSITIPDSVTSIGSYAFESCHSLTSINANSENKYYASEDGVLFNKDKSLLIKYPEGKTTEEYEIPNSVTSIEYNSFKYCENLTSIIIPDSVTTIGESAFSNCDNLISITFSENITTIENNLFWGCDNLTSVIIPDSVTSIEYNSFRYCKNLTSIIIPDSVTSIGYDAFLETKILNIQEGPVYYVDNWIVDHDYGITSIEVKKGTRGIGDSAFSGCSSLTSITIPDSVTSIGDNAFYKCTNLTSITLPDSITSIGKGVFSYCTDLSSVIIPDSVTNIGNEAFKECHALKLISIPNNVTSVGQGAFEECWNLRSIEIPSSIKNIEARVFCGCSSLTSIIIPNSVVSIGNVAFDDCGYPFNVYYSGTEEEWNAITIEEYNHYLTNATIHFNSRASGTCGAEGDNLTWILDSEGTLTISGEGEMENWDYNLRSPWYGYRADISCVIIEDSVTSVGDYSFYGCDNLTSITLPESVTSIGSYAFQYCSSLTSITIKNSKCEIVDSENTISDTATIYGYSGSTTEVYAEKYNRKFVSIFEEHTHKYSEWKEEKAATVWETGEAYRVCEICLDKEIKTIDKIEIDIKNNENYGIAEFTVVDAISLLPLNDATIYIESETDGECIISTDSDGKANQILPIGKNKLSVYKEGYLIRNITINISNTVQSIPRIGLSESPMVEGRLSVNEMTYEEIIEAGIDVDAPENNHVFKYETEIEFSASIDWLSIMSYVNADGDFLGFDVYTPEDEPNDDDGDDNNDEEEPDHSDDEVIYYHHSSKPKQVGDGIPVTLQSGEEVTIFPVNEKFFLIIYGEVKWLKEMFDVELLVLNHSNIDTIEDCGAEISLPDGLSLAPMSRGGQRLIQHIDHIAEGKSKSVHWYLRGDKEGVYNIDASLKGKIMIGGDDSFYEEFAYEYEAKDPIKVYAGSALHLTFEMPDSAFYKDDYTVKITLENVSDKTLYGVSHLVKGFKQGKITYYSDGSQKEEEYSSETLSKSEKVKEFKPGDKIVIEVTTNILFQSEIIQKQMEEMIGKVDGMETLYNGYSAMVKCVEMFDTFGSMISNVSKNIDNVIANGVLDADKVSAISDLADEVLPVLDALNNGDSKALSIINQINDSDLLETINNLADSETVEDFLMSLSPAQILGIADEISSLFNQDDQKIENFNVFDSVRTAIELIPVRFTVENVKVSTSDDSTTEIPYSVELKHVGARYFGVENVGKLIYSNVIAFMGEIEVPWNMQIFGVDEDPTGYRDAVKYIKATEKQAQQFVARDTDNTSEFKAWVETDDTTTFNGLKKSVKYDTEKFTMYVNDEDAVLKDGVLSFKGNNILTVIPNGKYDGVLGIEYEDGNVQKYVIETVEEHDCAGDDWLSFIKPMDGESGYEVKLCDICDDVIGIRAVSDDGEVIPPVVTTTTTCTSTSTTTSTTATSTKPSATTSTTSTSTTTSTTAITTTTQKTTTAISTSTNTTTSTTSSITTNPDITPEIVASGECGADGDNLTWTLDSAGTLIISGEGKMMDWVYSSFRIEDDGITVNFAGEAPPWYEWRKEIKYVIIEEGVTSIGDLALILCINTKYIELPQSINAIGKRTFAYCSSLSSICIPNQVAVIGAHAFEFCYALAEINIPNAITSVDYRVFSSCKELIKITIPKNVNRIEEQAFAGCKTLSNIIIQNPVCEIYDNADTLPAQTTIYGYSDSTAQEYAEKYGMKFVTLDDAEIIASGECGTEGDNLNWMLYGDGTLTISGEGEMLRMASWSEWGDYYDCIKNVIVKYGATSIGEMAFFNCKTLISVELPNSLTKIGKFSFGDASNLSLINIPINVTSIEYGAFIRCNGLTSITIPKNVLSIEDFAFKDCNNLSSIIITNPKCKIYDSEDTISDSATIYGYTDSTAQAYAEKYDRKFSPICEDGWGGSYEGCYDWDLWDGTLSIYTNEGSGEIVKNTFWNSPNFVIKEIILEPSIVYIDESSFNRCSQAEKITIKNPECEIFDSKYTFSNTATIYGYKCSTAEAYAKKYDRKFIALDAEQITTSSTTTTSTTTSSITSTTTTTTSTTTTKPTTTTTTTTKPTTTTTTTTKPTTTTTTTTTKPTTTTTTTTKPTTTTTTTTLTTTTTTTTTTIVIVNINKIESNGTSVVGALLILNGLDEDGESITFDKGDIIIEDDINLVNGVGENIVWFSGSSSVKVKLANGIYTLKEKTAPDEYLLSDDIVFEVRDGKITINGEEVESINMIDELIPITTTTTTTTTSTTTTSTTTTTTTTSTTTSTTTTTTTSTTTSTTTTTTTSTTTSTTTTTTTTTTTSTTTTTTTTTTTSTTTTTTTSTTTSTTTTTTTTSTTTSTTTTTTTTSTTTSTTTTTTTTSTTTSTTTTSTTTTVTSTTTSMTTTTPPTTTEPAYLLGDVNEDGSVDSSDASLVLAEYAKIQTGGAGEFTDVQYKAADVNKDDTVDSSDASKILAYYAMVSTGKKPTWD